MGSAARGRGFPAQVHGLRPPDHGAAQTCGKKYKANHKKSLKQRPSCGIMFNRDILLDLYPIVIKIPCSREKPGARDHKEVQKHE